MPADDVGADRGVALHDRELVVGQRPRLVQDRRPGWRSCRRRAAARPSARRAARGRRARAPRRRRPRTRRSSGRGCRCRRPSPPAPRPARRPWPGAAPRAGRPSARRPARSRPGRPAAGRTGGRPGRTRRLRTSNSSISPVAAPSITSGTIMLAPKPASSRKRCSAGSPPSPMQVDVSTSPSSTRRVARVLVELVVLGDHVQLGRRDHVGGPVGDRRGRRRRTPRSGTPRRSNSRVSSRANSDMASDESAASASARVDSITEIRSSKRRWELSDRWSIVDNTSAPPAGRSPPEWGAMCCPFLASA